MFVPIDHVAGRCGAVVKLERCVECQRLKGILTEANRRVQTARTQMKEIVKETDGPTDAGFSSMSTRRQSNEPARFSFKQPPAAVAPLQHAPSQEEFEKLKADSLAVSALLTEHIDTEHPRAEVEWLEPSTLDAAVKGVWSSDVGGHGGGGAALPTLTFARPVRIENRASLDRGSARKRARYESTAPTHARTNMMAGANARGRIQGMLGSERASHGSQNSIDAAVNSVGCAHTIAPAQSATRPELTGLQCQQQQIEEAILRMTPEQVAGLSDENAATYWRLKRERH